jgi:hypothetical protein
MAKRSSTKKPASVKKAAKRKAVKTKAVKKTAGKKKSAAKKTGRRVSGKRAKPKAAATIPPDSPDYPPYILTFEGSLIPDPPLIVRGTHTARVAGPPEATIDVTHNETDFGLPNLTIRFDKA